MKTVTYILLPDKESSVVPLSQMGWRQAVKHRGWQSLYSITSLAGRTWSWYFKADGKMKNSREVFWKDILETLALKIVDVILKKM